MTTRQPDEAVPAIDRYFAQLVDSELEAQFRESRFDYDLQRLRMAILVGALALAMFAVLDYAVISENLTFALVIRLVFGCLGAVGIYALTRTSLFRRRIEAPAWILLVSATLNYAAINAYCDTPDEYLSGFIIILMLLFFMLPLRFKAAVLMGVISTFIFSVVMTVTREIGTGELLTIYSQYLVTLFAGAFTSYQVNRLRRQEFIGERQIAEQRTKYLKLLTRILPPVIVERIQHGEERIADNIPDAVVVFADVVGFTQLSANHSPDEVVNFLNNLFGKFDDLTERHGLEKIKTIGDSYMVAGGVPEPQSEHVASAARLALEMVKSAGECIGPDGRAATITVGLHSGPLLAGVIGETRFGYDIWGDTVNLASRLQGSADPGCIVTSSAVRNALEKQFVFHSIGMVPLKGKGDVEIWHLLAQGDEKAEIS